MTDPTPRKPGLFTGRLFARLWEELKRVLSVMKGEWRMAPDTQHEAAIEAAAAAEQQYRDQQEAARKRRSAEAFGHPGALIAGCAIDPIVQRRIGFAAYDAARSGEAEGELREAVKGVLEVWDGDHESHVLESKLIDPIEHLREAAVSRPVEHPKPRTSLLDEPACKPYPEPRQDQPVNRASGERAEGDKLAQINKIAQDAAVNPNSSEHENALWQIIDIAAREHPKTGEW